MTIFCYWTIQNNIHDDDDNANYDDECNNYQYGNDNANDCDDGDDHWDYWNNVDVINYSDNGNNDKDSDNNKQEQ